MSPLVISILTSVGTAVLHDLIGYARARQQWRNDPIAHAKPDFDKPLFITRATIGLISGGLAGLGIQQGIAQGVLP